VPIKKKQEVYEIARHADTPIRPIPRSVSARTKRKKAPLTHWKPNLSLTVDCPYDGMLP
jgi:hypothetical protein